MIAEPASADPRIDLGKVTLRREAKVAAIVESAWKLAREHGIAGVSLHALAREVGMRQPSLYAYFDSKHAALKRCLAEFVAFALEDPARYELLFERHVPGFTPSPWAYLFAEEVLGRVYKVINEAGVTRQGDIDCIVAMVAGLMEAQLSNDPGGNRWIRHLNRLVDLYVDDALERSRH